MFTINQVAKKYNLSRSTLLYYDKINLLTPSGRSPANYRLYSSKDIEKMEKISMFRAAGLSLDAIAEILENSKTKSSNILEKRLINLNQEISQLRRQQQLIVELLGNDSLISKTKTMSKQQWVSILKASGLDEEAMHQWHINFERDLPEMHQDFLESLGCDEAEVKAIRAWSNALP